MNTFEKYLENCWGVFDPREFGYPLAFVYRIIQKAVQDKSDKLTLTPTHFVWSKNEILLGQDDISWPKPNTSYRQILEIILERDLVIKQHLELITKTPEEISFRILLDEPNTPKK